MTKEEIIKEIQNEINTYHAWMYSVDGFDFTKIEAKLETLEWVLSMLK